MIDWLDFELPYSGSDLVGGYIQKVDEYGAIKYELSDWKQVEGSWSSKVRVKGECGYLRISGCPAKFMTGQNLFGSNDVPLVAREFLKSVCLALDLSPFLLLPELENATINRIDINEMYSLQTNERVNLWLKIAKKHASGRQQLTTGKGSTVYIGQHSRRKAWKFYNKMEEMKKHPPLVIGDKMAFCYNYSIGKLRSELVLRSPWLKSKLVSDGVITTRRKLSNGSYYKSDDVLTLKYLKNWGSEMAKIIYLSEIKKTNLPAHSDQLEGMCIDENLIPSTYRGTYQLWRRGVDVQSSMSRASYYRHKKYFKEQHGIDLSSFDVVDSGESIPLLSLLVGEVSSPLQEDLDWFYENNQRSGFCSL